jgi:hypothetical protein
VSQRLVSQAVVKGLKDSRQWCAVHVQPVS